MENMGSFTLVVSFSRHDFRINEDSVAAALESALGGSAIDFWLLRLVIKCLFLMFLAKMWGFTLWTHDPTPALSLNATLICGEMGNLIGFMSLRFGRKNVMLSGSWLVLLSVGLPWVC